MKEREREEGKDYDEDYKEERLSTLGTGEEVTKEEEREIDDGRRA